jgi:hypothetical protein
MKVKREGRKKKKVLGLKNKIKTWLYQQLFLYSFSFPFFSFQTTKQDFSSSTEMTNDPNSYRKGL